MCIHSPIDRRPSRDEQRTCGFEPGSAGGARQVRTGDEGAILGMVSTRSRWLRLCKADLFQCRRLRCWQSDATVEAQLSRIRHPKDCLCGHRTCTRVYQAV